MSTPCAARPPAGPRERPEPVTTVPHGTTAPAVPGLRGARGQAGRLLELLEGTGASCELKLPSGEVLRSGIAEPAFRVVIHSMRVLGAGLDELAWGRAYVEGDLDIEGDLLALLEVRRRLKDRVRLGSLASFLARLFLVSPTRSNRRAIADHYSYGDDFYHLFTDTGYHFYSHCLFDNADETLEQAAEHKLESMVQALRLEPGMRLLDIGSGWGAVADYCSPRGVHVTSLTLADDSYAYLMRRKEAGRLQGEVVHSDFLAYRPERPFDAVVIYGVIEHIPNYRHFCARAWDCLVPGGRLYLDASSSKEKYSMSAFTRRYIWHGVHTFLALPDMLQEMIWHGFEVETVRRETRDYELTMLHWARRFDRAKEVIVARWGEEVYRAFRVFLWGGSHAFRCDELQAYHLVVRRREDPGPRPGLWRRARNFTRGLA